MNTLGVRSEGGSEAWDLKRREEGGGLLNRGCGLYCGSSDCVFGGSSSEESKGVLVSCEGESGYSERASGGNVNLFPSNLKEGGNGDLTGDCLCVGEV